MSTVHAAATAPRLQVRRARPSDAAAILALEDAFPTDRMSARSVRRLITAPSACVLVAVADAQMVAALVLLLRRNSRWARIYSVVVADAWRGRGVGRRLIGAAERRARALDCEGISLEVRVDNAAARGLYRALGYQELRTLPGYYADSMPGVRLRKPFRAASVRFR